MKPRDRLRLSAVFLGVVLGLAPAFAAPAVSGLMPVPAALQFAEGRLAVAADFRVAVGGAHDARVRDGLARLLRRMEERTGLTLGRGPTGEFLSAANPADASLVIECAAPGAAVPFLGEDESYTLDITPRQAVLRAATGVGALRGLASLEQLLQSDPAGWFFPALGLTDRPRFPWRGLLIDVARHWQPVEVIERNLDGMALVKLNVLHLHLTDDQGFRIESKKYPRLQELGSDGHYFTQDQMRGLIAYAAARGIRVVPEFDIPGHATSWVTAEPGLASAPGPYALARKWGVLDPVLDPTNEQVYGLLDGFLGEMAGLFPDAYLHIGGDENNGVQWSASAPIQAFIREHQLKDNAGLHAYFNTRVHAILAKHGKKLIGWDEILHPDLPAGSVIQSWRGPAGVAQATGGGFPAVLSNGYYIDLCQPAAVHYLNDPAPAGAPLSAAQRALVLGGEATMWSEWVTPGTIDSRIWPRTAAIAERLWSPESVRDVPDMYRRLTMVSQRLEEAGLQHESYLAPALRRLAGDGATAADLAMLRVFVDLLEPVKNYQRSKQQPGATQFTPLTGLADCARPDSAAGRRFAAAVGQYLTDPRSADAAVPVAAILGEWHKCAEQLLARLPSFSPQLAGAQPLLQAWRDASAVGLKLCEKQAVSPAEAGEAIQRATVPHQAVELPIGPALVSLLSGHP